MFSKYMQLKGLGQQLADLAIETIPLYRHADDNSRRLQSAHRCLEIFNIYDTRMKHMRGAVQLDAYTFERNA